MALKSKRPSLVGSRGSKKRTFSFSGKMRCAGVLVATKRRRATSVETIEARLERKAEVADTKTFVTKSLGQMTREQRHKLLYGG